MLALLRLLILAVLAVVLWKAVALIVRLRRASAGGDLKCRTCRHCELIDRDGVMCRYGDNITLKTLVHVRNCMDYEEAARPTERR